MLPSRKLYSHTCRFYFVGTYFVRSYFSATSATAEKYLLKNLENAYEKHLVNAISTESCQFTKIGNDLFLSQYFVQIQKICLYVLLKFVPLKYVAKMFLVIWTISDMFCYPPFLRCNPPFRPIPLMAPYWLLKFLTTLTPFFDCGKIRHSCRFLQHHCLRSVGFSLS